MDARGSEGTERPTEDCLAKVLVVVAGPVEALLRAVIDTRDAEGQRVKSEDRRQQGVRTRVGTEACLSGSLAHLVVVVEHRDDVVAEPGVRLLADQCRVAEQGEVVSRIAYPFDKVFELVLHVVDAQRRVQAGDLHGFHRALASAGDLAYQVEVLLAETDRELLDDRGEVPRRAEIHVLDGVDT